MNYSSSLPATGPRRRILVSTVLAGLLSAGLTAQQAPTASDPAPEDAETVSLNPFTVTSERETGYQPQSTLAGTRLNTPIKDLASGVSVLTRDFISDVGATNINELLVYSVGGEAAGSQGNFGNASPDDDTGVGNRSTPQSSTRIRGLTSATNTKGFFETSIPLDEYNTDFVTVNRGANAVLFGIGSPAGVIDTTLVGADLNRDQSKFTYRYGDTGAHRGSMALNRMIIPGKLAVRLNAVRDRERYMQEPAFENKERVYAAVKYQITDSTLFSASFENGDTTANRPHANLPYDSSRLWRDAGSVPFNWKRYDDPSYPGYVDRPAGVVLNQDFPTMGEGQIFFAMMVFPRNPDMSFTTLNNGTTLGGFRYELPQGTGVNQLRPGLVYIPNAAQSAFSGSMNQDLRSEIGAGNLGNGVAFYETTNYGEASDQKNRASAFGIPASTYGVDSSVMWIRPPGQALQVEGFKNNEFFAWDERQIDQTSRQTEKFNTYSASLSHTTWADSRGRDRLGIELTYNKENFSRMDDNKFIQQNNSAHVRIDANVYLPTGMLNPNVGRPYINGGGQVQKNRVQNERENLRATAFARYDFADRDSGALRWLGRHTLTGLWEQADLKTTVQSSQLKPFGAHADTITGGNITAFLRTPAVLAYIGDSIFDVNSDGSVITLKDGPMQFEPITGTLTPGHAGKLTYFSAPGANSATGTPATPANVQGGFVSQDVTLTEFYTRGTAERNTITSQAFVLQSYWLKDHLISTFGWRRDERDTVQKVITPIGTAPGFNSSNGVVPPAIAAGYQNNMEFSHDDFALSKPVRIQAGEIKSFNFVAKWPQKLFRLPYNADLSVFYGDSENFSPEGANIDAFQTVLPGATGENKEWGINVAIGEKVSIRINRFESQMINFKRKQSLYNTMVNNALLQTALGWHNSHLNTPTPGVNRVAQAEELLALVPDVKSLSRWTVNSTTGLASYINPTGSITDTESIEAKGVEFEMTYNPFRGLRLTANVAKQEAQRSNIAPAMKKLFAALEPFYTKYALYPHSAPNTTNYPVLEPMTETSPSWADRNSEWWRSNIAEPYTAIIDTEGTSASEIRKWRANFVANYTFGRNTIMKGWVVGTAIRWQDKATIGYISDYLPLPAGVPAGTLPTVYTDPNRPVHAPAETYVDGWLGYSRRIFNDKVNWSIRLSGKNIFYDSDPIAIKSLADGTPGLTRIPPERRWFVTSTFEF